jgi:hypothetical protein
MNDTLPGREDLYNGLSNPTVQECSHVHTLIHKECVNIVTLPSSRVSRLFHEECSRRELYTTQRHRIRLSVVAGRRRSKAGASGASPRVALLIYNRLGPHLHRADL